LVSNAYSLQKISASLKNPKKGSIENQRVDKHALEMSGESLSNFYHGGSSSENPSELGGLNYTVFKPTKNCYDYSFHGIFCVGVFHKQTASI